MLYNWCQFEAVVGTCNVLLFAEWIVLLCHTKNKKCFAFGIKSRLFCFSFCSWWIWRKVFVVVARCFYRNSRNDKTDDVFSPYMKGKRKWKHTETEKENTTKKSGKCWKNPCNPIIMSAIYTSPQPVYQHDYLVPFLLFTVSISALEHST